MADLIPIDELTELKSASAVKEVANEAVKIHEKQAVAHVINTAANSGEHSAIYKNALSSEVEELLKAQGYKITRHPNTDYLVKIEGF